MPPLPSLRAQTPGADAVTHAKLGFRQRRQQRIDRDRRASQRTRLRGHKRFHLSDQFRVRAFGRQALALGVGRQVADQIKQAANLGEP